MLKGKQITDMMYFNLPEQPNEEPHSKPSTPTSVQSDRSAPSTPPPGVNRRTAVLFSKKAFRKDTPKDNGQANTPTPPRKPGRPPRIKPNQEKEKPTSDSPQPPVLELMIPSPGRSPKSPGSRKRSASAITSQADPVPSPPKRTSSMSEPLPSFSEPPDITKRDNFMTYRHAEHIRSSSESESTSGHSSSDESLSDSSSTGSSDSRSGNSIGLIKDPFYISSNSLCVLLTDPYRMVI